jgi:hypothetical protein
MSLVDTDIIIGEFTHLSAFRSQVGVSLNKGFDNIINQPSASFSRSTGSSRQTLSAIFSNKRMNESVMLSSHIHTTKLRCQKDESEYLLVPQDTTYYNYHKHSKLSGLGMIGTSLRGIVQHNTLVLNEKGVSLGLIKQHNWTRKGEKDFSNTSEKESQKWINSIEAVNEHLSGVGKKIVSICDREGDFFDLFKYQRKDDTYLLIRLYENRFYEICNTSKWYKLGECEEHLQDEGSKKVQIFRNKKEVMLTLSVRAGAVSVAPHADLSRDKHKVRNMYLVIAREQECIDVKTNKIVEVKEEDKAIWYLLTDLPVGEHLSASKIVDFYAHRWQIERFHFILKSGALNVENLRFSDVKTLCNALALYGVVAWKILTINTLSMDEKAQAIDVFEQEEINLLKKLSGKEIITLIVAVQVLAGLVGFKPSKKYPYPGIKILVEALERFYFIKIGAEAATKPVT